MEKNECNNNASAVSQADVIITDFHTAGIVMDSFTNMNDPILMQSVIGVLVDILSAKCGKSVNDIYGALMILAPQVEKELGKMVI